MVDFAWLNKLAESISSKKFIEEENLENTIKQIEILPAFFGGYSYKSRVINPEYQNLIHDLKIFMEQKNKLTEEELRKRKFNIGMIYELEKEKNGFEREGTAKNDELFKRFFEKTEFYFAALEKIVYLCNKVILLKDYTGEFKSYKYAFERLNQGNPEKKRKIIQWEELEKDLKKTSKITYSGGLIHP